MRNFEGRGLTTSATCSYSSGPFNVLDFIIINKSAYSVMINLTQKFANSDVVNISPYNYVLVAGQAYQETERQINLATGESFTLAVMGSAESVDYVFNTDAEYDLTKS